MPLKRPYTIALTGGPCAGKTTLLERLRAANTIMGRQVLFVPEAATMLVHRGLVIGQDVVHFQTETMRLQLQLESEAWEQAGKQNAPCLVVCDRGTLDGAGYCTREEFEAIAAGFGQNRSTLAARYDLVVHLASTAVDNPSAYTLENNHARHETLEQAVKQEHRTLQAWAGHPNRAIVSSATSFEEKISQAIHVIERAVSAYQPAADQT